MIVSGFDPHKDTAIELLHTILLGPVKYVWYLTHTSFSKEQLAMFCTRLQSSSIDGLAIAPIRSKYLVQYRNSLVGKQFKQILQTAVFHLSDMVDDRMFALWKALGFLGALLWFPSINNLEEYIVRAQAYCVTIIDTSIGRCYSCGEQPAGHLCVDFSAQDPGENQAASPCSLARRYTPVWANHRTINRGI